MRDDTAAPRRIWIPRQHGAWAMLAVPLLLGVSANRPSPWQGLLAVTAVSGYLVSTAALAWTRAQRHGPYRTPLAVYGAAFGVSGLVLLVVHPVLAAALIVMVPAAGITVAATMSGHARGLAASLAQVALALVLVPAAGVVAGAADGPTIVRATLAAGAYLVGTLLPWPYAVLAVGLALRAAALPALQERLAGGPRRLRPIHLGLIEIAASSSLVALAFLSPV